MIEGIRFVASVFILVILFATASLRAQENLIVTGDYWTYWDWGTQPDPNWAHPTYEDFDWEVGPSPLGFGEPAATPLRFGITTAYFRGYFYLDPVPDKPLLLRVRRDDGVIVYLNGWEVFRDNMPPGPPDESTPAIDDVEPDGFLETSIDQAFVVPGFNVVAVEVHQVNIFSDDLLLDLHLSVSSGPPGRRVAISSPADGTMIGPGSDVTIAATAGPVDEVVAVDFYEGANLLGRDEQSPFEALWPAPPPSNYVLRAVALFNDSAAKTSAPVNVTVAGSINVIRGPYLQMGTPTNIIVKWRTDMASDSVVRYGVSPDNLDRRVRVGTITTEHEVQLTGLSPDTKYYYSIGSAALTQAGGPDHFFITSPAGPKPTRIWVIGDSGGAAVGDPGSYQVRDAYYAFAGTRYTDLG